MIYLVPFHLSYIGLQYKVKEKGIGNNTGIAITLQPINILCHIRHRNGFLSACLLPSVSTIFHWWKHDLLHVWYSLILKGGNLEDGKERVNVLGRGKTHSQLKEVHSPERTLLCESSQFLVTSARCRIYIVFFRFNLPRGTRKVNWIVQWIISVCAEMSDIIA